MLESVEIKWEINPNKIEMQWQEQIAGRDDQPAKEGVYLHRGGGGAGHGVIPVDTHFFVLLLV